ncbi:hypothetical protein O3602_02180 [Streptococcus sp. 27098_8_186]|uniref:hypothetical protein n=1 Tax=unclassified Streptococcus TaxID=2608887 RepID=UPI00352E00C2
MAYQQEERETVVRYDEQDNAWYIETNVRRHISKFLKMAKAFEELNEEKEAGRVVSIRAKLSDLDNFSVSPFVRNKRKGQTNNLIQSQNRF